jgi:putative peptidoglycan lipid II flippase
LSRHVAHEDHEGYRETLMYSLRSMMFWIVPAAVGLAVLSGPIAALLFQRGAFSADDVAKTARATAFYAPGLVGLAGSKVLSQGFYAMGNTRTPVFIGLGTVMVNVFLSLVLGFTRLGFYALPAANSLAALFNFSVLWWQLHQTVGHLDTPFLKESLWKIGLASVGMGVMAWGVTQWTSTVVWQVTGGVGGGIMVFGIVAWVWKMPEAAEILRALPGRHREE